MQEESPKQEEEDGKEILDEDDTVAAGEAERNIDKIITPEEEAKREIA